ncbi:MAG: hypothetical protein LBU40_01645, partial [Methanobrevibacter sp.]|nr:hypothetical protein [Methanobrevibacter sp.]
EEQKKEDSQATLTTVLFDDEYEILHDRVNLKEVELISADDYYTRGMTALLDAIGKTIQNINRQISKLNGKNKPGKVIFVITTDGYENASREFSIEKINKLIKKQKSENWEFIFFGANIDTFKTAQNMGINHSFDYEASKKGILKRDEMLCDMVSEYRKIK